VRRHFQRNARTFGPSPAVVDVVRKTLLARIEVDRRDALAGFEQRDRNVQRRG